MSEKQNWKETIGKVVYALLGGMCSMLCVMGYYPLVPAFYAVCCLGQKRSLLLYIGLFTGMGLCMPVGSSVKYLFLIFIVGIGVRFYLWANRRCSGWMAGMIAGLATAAMNCSGMALTVMDKSELILGLSEGLLVFGATVLLNYLFQMASELGKCFSVQGTAAQEESPVQEQYDRVRMDAFAEAVDGLSVAFATMGREKSPSGYENLDVLEQEITGKLCATCDGCAICWERKENGLSEKIRNMLKAVVDHSPKEEILVQNYMEDCPRYSGMVEEAIWAFSRMELNEAWYRRLQENRRVIAGQLEAMSDLMQGWSKGRRCLDKESKVVLAKIGFEAKERGLVAEQVHIYEDEHHRKSITAMVASKWGGGIPSRNYIRALEKATGLSLRLGKEARSIFTKESVAVTAYEDTRFYAMSGVAGRTKDTQTVSGDNFSLFALENGHYHICLSDGMGSGPAASKESDLVVDLMEKFMEAGFCRETAIRMMNSAMVLQGEDNSFSTMDFAALDLYTGELELTKIGAAASFVRSKGETSCMRSTSLPAGADVSQVVEPLKRTMRNGDFLVMVTDGVLEYLHVKNPEEKLSEMISDINTDNAGVLAKSLMERVLLFTGGHAMDDMTILVTGIWEK